MNVVRKHACLFEREAFLAGHIKPVVHQLTPEGRPKDTAAKTRNEDKVITQIKYRMRGPKQRPLSAAIAKDRRTNAGAVAVVFGLMSDVILYSLNAHASYAASQVTVSPYRRLKTESEAKFARDV